MTMRSIKLWGVAVVLLALMPVVSAQTLQESVEARNKGAELMGSGDIEGAIAELEKCVEISKQVGADADDNKLVAEKALPDLYLQKAVNILNTKDYEAALKAFDETIAVAEKYNNADVKEKAEKPVVNVYYAIGATAFQKNDLASAIENMDIVIARDPDYAKAYYIKGASYQKQKDEAKMSENYQLAIEKAEVDNDKTTLKNAKATLSKYYYNKGITSMQSKKYDDAIASFTKTTTADDTFADAYYRLASCYNAQKNWDLAINNGEKALEHKTGDKDGIYFELGNAYKGKKDNAKACNAFKQVKAEPFVANAKYQIETVLKCK
jgi:tetratricopeptide (TPR) repeat protein